MKSIPTTIAERIPGPAYLWFSVLVFGAAASIVRVLSDLGAQFPIDGRNAISFCNLLFAGNACAAVTLYAVHHKTWNLENLRRLSKKDWVSLLGLALLANGVAPWLFFLGLENTTVTSVVLVSQIEPPLVLALAWLVFGDRFGLWTVFGATLCLTGVAMSVLLQPDTGNYMIGRGELYAAFAAITYACATIFARLCLRHIPLGIYSVTRSLAGTTVFFIVANILFGPMHFVDLASPFLWKWMVLYGGLVIVSGQLAWDYGIRRSKLLDISITTSFAPVAGVMAAFIILGEQPMLAQYQGGVVLILGIAICLVAARQTASAAMGGQQIDPAISTKGAMPEQTVAAFSEECRAGFKGV
ncbi:MAG: DMT family transporter [Proteobacteria bacterium]|nr:DMT family transporter [Pseudomonadota bacterium]